MEEFWQFIFHFVLNTLVIGMITCLLYYPRSKRRDYSFVFMLISLSVFMMIYLLESVKMELGFALGLFAVFGIIRYRTEQMPVREMTYLFVLISIAVINAMEEDLVWWQLVIINVIYVLAVWTIESSSWVKHVSVKTIKYDRIDLITPEKRPQLIEDLTKRTGLKIVKLEIGDLDFLKDMAIIRISYETDNNEVNSSDGLSTSFNTMFLA